MATWSQLLSGEIPIETSNNDNSSRGFWLVGFLCVLFGDQLLEMTAVCLSSMGGKRQGDKERGQRLDRFSLQVVT